MATRANFFSSTEYKKYQRTSPDRKHRETRRRRTQLFTGNKNCKERDLELLPAMLRMRLELSCSENFKQCTADILHLPIPTLIPTIPDHIAHEYACRVRQLSVPSPSGKRDVPMYSRLPWDRVVLDFRNRRTAILCGGIEWLTDWKFELPSSNHVINQGAETSYVVLD